MTCLRINPTGSTGYGEELTDAIQNDWGGAPYEDLVLGFDYIADNYDFIDTNNAIAAGGSYGGVSIPHPFPFRHTLLLFSSPTNTM